MTKSVLLRAQWIVNNEEWRVNSTKFAFANFDAGVDAHIDPKKYCFNKNKKVIKMKIILASKSPRRKELMNLITKNYEVIVSNADETHVEGLSIEEESKRLAYIKAKKVFDETSGNRIVIGSDSMVIKNGNIYEKPKDALDAKRMIQELQGKNHTVITSLCVLIEENNNYKEYIDYDVAEVYFKSITDEEIDKWIQTGNPLDKAGAYAIQSEFGVHVEKINGNYTTVVGLPIHKLYDVIKEYI